MRADRLVAILLLLQARGQVTAAEVAEELEVSERTARRDLDALGMAGIPLYSVRGRCGGWRLAGGGRTDLSGLSAGEARALFLLAGPAASATPEVRSALRKLVRALPEPLRARAEAASTAVVIDSTAWDRPGGARPAPPLLDAVQEAVVDRAQLRLGYVGRSGDATTRTVHPLGVAAKGANWYLVADTDDGLRTFRVDRITSAEVTGEPVVRPEGFELEEAWRLITDRVDRLRTPVVATALVAADMLHPLRYALGTRLGIGPATKSGRVHVELRGHAIGSLAAEIAGFGDAVEVLDPPELRRALAAVGADLVGLYDETPGSPVTT